MWDRVTDERHNYIIGLKKDHAKKSDWAVRAKTRWSVNAKMVTGLLKMQKISKLKAQMLFGRWWWWWWSFLSTSSICIHISTIYIGWSWRVLQGVSREVYYLLSIVVVCSNSGFWAYTTNIGVIKCTSLPYLGADDPPKTRQGKSSIFVIFVLHYTHTEDHDHCQVCLSTTTVKDGGGRLPPLDIWSRQQPRRRHTELVMMMIA